ncbi:NAD(P)-dependent oxidoreductase [Polynucleobacter sp. MWH-Spelu-300-X4]|uniref:NAD-dependent epimerase/dehydratase family protein n=1 Tax=Polynucleobacter sp. MWH-Spelu-300-X4 TaxID=2689109 RepID=UPI001BFD5747|nr:NAD(P)-dependent oxidoreductase [Polynucleobacter sp. MWH-Spelu-300-X4]QWD80040.1 NAD(P)-dependent oxidoreductase [Polynucleobacter sp. MWH-Spelu-300-X4]
MNILITGAGGFLGSALARRLGEMDHQVSLLVRKNTDLYRLTDLSIYKIGRCETDQEITQFIREVYPDIVIHTACCYGRNGESIIKIIDSNLRFGALILNVINSLEKKVSFINTGTVLSRDVSLYALTKIQFQELGIYETKHSNRNTQFINIKLQHMYGPGDSASKFTSYVINACRNNVSKLPLSLGEQTRDFVYIDDVVDAYITILENLSKLEKAQHIELGSGEAPCLRDFVETVHKLTSSKTELLFGQIPYRENDVMCMVANIDKLKSMGWIPKFDLEAGIKKTIEMDVAK